MATNDSRLGFSVTYIEKFKSVLDSLPLDELARVLEILENALKEGRRVFLAGNGGSASTASHMASDLMLGVAKAGRPGLKTIALTDNVPIITATANDQGYNEIFSAQLAQLGQAGDILIVVSGSGNSANVVRVVEVAREMGIYTVGLLGMGGGRVSEIVDLSVIVPCDDYEQIEDAHLMINHLATSYLRSRSSDLRNQT